MLCNRRNFNVINSHNFTIYNSDTADARSYVVGETKPAITVVHGMTHNNTVNE